MNLVNASDIVDFSNIAKNVGFIFNNSLLMVPHITAVCKSFKIAVIIFKALHGAAPNYH